MTELPSGSWYIPAKPSSYSIVGFVVAMLGGTVLAGLADLLGQFGTAHLAGLAPETILRTLAVTVVDPARIADNQQVLIIGVCVHLAIILAAVLVYLIAAARIPLINSVPEISILGYGSILGLLALAVLLLPRWPESMAPAASLSIISTFFRYVFLVAMPIAIVAKLTARGA